MAGSSKHARACAASLEMHMCGSLPEQKPDNPFFNDMDMRSIHDRMIDSAGNHTAQSSPTRAASFSYRKQIASAIS
jgi:hypothetical protein